MVETYPKMAADDEELPAMVGDSAFSSPAVLGAAEAEVSLVMAHQKKCKKEALAMLESELPEGWVACQAGDGAVYYHNKLSGLSRWSNPAKPWASRGTPVAKTQVHPLSGQLKESEIRSNRRMLNSSYRRARIASKTEEEPPKNHSRLDHSVYDARSRHVDLPTPASLFSDSTTAASREDLHGRVFAIHGLLSATEAQTYAMSAEDSGFQGSDVHHEFPAEVRNNSRLVHFSDALAQTLWRRLAPLLMHKDIYLMQPMGYCAEGRWKPVGVNSCFRISRYLPGEHFAKHCDGMYANDEGECSIYSLILYLNDDFKGGELELPERTVFAPRVGSAVLFPHDTLHQARSVLSGAKYVARSELMFRCVDRAAPPSVPACVDDPLFQQMAALYEQIGDLARSGDANVTTAAYQEALGIQIKYKGTSVPEPSASALPLNNELLARALSFLEPLEILKSRSSNLAWSSTTQLGKLWQCLYSRRWPTSFSMMEDASRNLDPELKDWLGLYRNAHTLKTKASVCTVFLTDMLQATAATGLDGAELPPVWAGADHGRIGIGWDSSFRQRAGWSIGIGRNPYSYGTPSLWYEKREVQWRILPELFAHAFRSLDVQPSETRVLVPIVPGVWSRSVRSRAVKFLMGRFEVPKIHFPPAPLCALLAHGMRTGTVVWGCRLGKSAVYCYKEGKEVAKSMPFNFEHASAHLFARLLRNVAKTLLGNGDNDVLNNVVFSCQEPCKEAQKHDKNGGGYGGEKGRASGEPPISVQQRWTAIVGQITQRITRDLHGVEVVLHSPIADDVMIGAERLDLSELHLFGSEPELIARWEWRWLLDEVWQKLPDYAAGVFEGALRQDCAYAVAEEGHHLLHADLEDFTVRCNGQVYQLTRFLRGRPSRKPDRRKPEDLDLQLRQSHADDMQEVEAVEGDAVNVRTLAGRLVFSASKNDVETLLVSDVLDEVSEIMDTPPDLLQLTCDGVALPVEQYIQELLDDPGSVEALVILRTKKKEEDKYGHQIREHIPEDLPGEFDGLDADQARHNWR